MIVFQIQILLFIIICFLSQAARIDAASIYHPKHRDPIQESWLWTSIPELNGKGVRCLSETKDGSMIFGTAHGVSIYDGLQWTHYTEQDGIDGTVVSLCVAKDSSIYAATESSIFRFQKGMWSRVFPKQGRIIVREMEQITQTFDGSIWAGTLYGALRIQNGEQTLYTTQRIASALKVLAHDLKFVIVPDSNVWETQWTDGVGIFCLSKNPRIILAVAPGSPADSAGLSVGDMIISEENVTFFKHSQIRASIDKPCQLTVVKANSSDTLKVRMKNASLQGSFYHWNVFQICEMDKDNLFFGIKWDPLIVRLNTSENDSLESTLWHSYFLNTKGKKPVIYKISDGRMIIGYNLWTSPVFVYEPENDIIKEYDLPVSDLFRVTDILETSDGNLFITSFDYLLQRRNQQWYVYPWYEIQHSSIEGKFFESSDGFLWFMAVNGNVWRIDVFGQRWNSYQDLHFQCESKTGEKWFLTRDGKAVCKKNNTFTQYDKQDGLIDNINALYSTEEGIVWALGSHEMRAATARFVEGTWQKHVHPLPGFTQFSFNAFYESKNGEIWLGLSEQSMENTPLIGLVQYQPETRVYNYYHYPLVNHFNFTIGGTPKGDLWLGGENLNIFDGTNISQILDYPVSAIKNTSNGNVWVATSVGGLFYFDNKDWRRWTIDDGLASYSISDIGLTLEGNVYAATNKGISYCDNQSCVSHILPESIRIPYKEGTLRVDTEGTVWINRCAKSWYEKFDKSDYNDLFFSISYKKSNLPPESNIKIYSDHVSYPGNTYISWEGKDTWHETSVDKLLFSWSMDDGSWSPFSPQREHQFIGLESGKHIFKVRARDLDMNVEPEPARISIVVQTPVWRQAWFIGLILFFVGSIIILVLYIIRVHDRRVHFEAEKQHEVDMMKLRFFTNVSHELRTPLTLILAPLQKLVSKNEPDPFASLAYKHAGRLLRLVNQLLDFRKLESGGARLELTKANLVVFIQQIVKSFEELARQKHINLQFFAQEEYLFAMFDFDKFEKVFYNLIHNALKFTPKNGSVTVSIKNVVEMDTLFVKYTEISVTDTGIGIPHDKQAHIFDYLYQAKPSGTNDHQGTGIGLYLVKEYVELHHGRIKVESEPGQGTKVIVHIPLEYQKHSEERVQETVPEERFDKDIDAPEQVKKEKELTNDFEKSTILIIEDNMDIRQFLVNELDSEYKVVEAENGDKGLEIARQIMPELIICDIMMPGIDGNMLCRELKTNELTSHIPVILLTALNSEQHQINGLETGADDYVTKPFHTEVLKIRIKNLIESRQKFRERFSKEIWLKPSDIAITSVDEKFLTRVIEIVDHHIPDSDFTVEYLSQKVGMTRMTLFLKIKKLTNMSPTEFIRTLRLKRASQLLCESDLRISEIAFQVGFSDVNYFGTVFRKHFGMSPTQYLQKQTTS